MARKSSKRRRRSPSRRRRAPRRRARAGSVVIVSNPKRRTRRRRSAGKRRRSHARRRVARRRNPSTRWGKALKATAIGFVSGMPQIAIDYGASKAPVGAYGQAAIGAGGGLLLAIGTAKWIDERAGAGMAGAAGATTLARVILAVQMAQLSSGAKAESAAEKESGTVFKAEAGAVYKALESGALVKVREAGKSLPSSMTRPPVRFVSAHNVR